MGHARCSFACLISSITSERAKVFYSAVSTYHAARNKFERFRVFWESISRFEFEFRRREKYFFERFEFLVCSKFNHTPCGRTCAVDCLFQHNFISNVVASVTIHDNFITNILI